MNSKFQIGDEVICIEGNPLMEAGAGWKLGLIFIIEKITNPPLRYRLSTQSEYIYWKGINRWGIFESHLELITKLSQYETLKRKGLI